MFNLKDVAVAIKKSTMENVTSIVASGLSLYDTSKNAG